ncbi:MAG TPA: S9 family peptidase [Candidatus Didemnitutus sp.]|nr:S9 family peptidase [Candidatus Didemnitutus sp.]
MRSRCSGLFLLTLLSASTLPAASHETLDLLFATRTFAQAAISPDGKQVAWVEMLSNPDRTPTSGRTITVGSAAGGSERRVTAGDARKPHNEGDVAWSPDGTQLAFLSDAAKKGQLELYVVGANGGTPREVGHLTGFLSNPRWSPDGRSIALLQVESSNAKTGAVEAAARATGEVAAEISEQRITVLEVATGHSRFVTDASTYVYEFDWAPDSHRLAFIAAPGDGDNHWWIARLFTLEVGDGKMTELLKPDLQIAVPRWSPDGRSVAFIQGLMSDDGATGGDVWVVPATGGVARNLTPGRNRSPAWIHWSSDSSTLLVSEWKNGGSAISRLEVATGKTEDLWSGDETIQATFETESLSLSADGKQTAVIRSSFAQPPEVWTGVIGKWRPLTHANAGRVAPWGTAERIEWKSDGYDVQGWLVPPLTIEPGKRYPLVVTVHGGPASQATPRWPPPGPSGIPLAADGYFIFVANPRGSYGQGEKFAAANVRDFGGGDLRDILAGVDAVLATHPIDPNALGLQGWSYGGFMTMWALTQTGRFRAACAGAGISNWQSYYGENLIDQWMIPYFGSSVYDDPDAYARCSAINFIKKVQTPVLIVVGERDKECPSPQSFEYWHALRTIGTTTTLVVYPDEGHHFRNPAHIEDLLDRTSAWFGRYLKR